MSYPMCDDCKYVKYSFDGSTKCGYHGEKNCNFIPREKKGSVKDKDVDKTDKQIFENEIKCIIRRNEGVCNGGSDCIKCDLLMESKEILKCYNRAIQNIDLINHQKAENERLNIELQSMRSAANSYKMHYEKAQIEIDRLQKNIDGLNIFTTNHIKVIRLQAMKEFAEELKRKATVVHKTHSGKHWYEIDDNKIDNIIKEKIKEGAD